MLISAKRKSTEKDKGTVIFYRVSGKTSWGNWYLSNGLKERRKKVKRIFRRKVFQAEGRTRLSVWEETWSRRLRAREGGLGGWSRVSRGQNESEREQETRFRGALMWRKQGARRRFWTEECLGKLASILGNFGTKSECSCSWKWPLPILWQKKQSPICRERRMSQVCGEKMKSEAGREVSLLSHSCSCSC